jgi:hypothetical protein
MIENRETYNLPYLGSITDGFQGVYVRTGPYAKLMVTIFLKIE